MVITTVDNRKLAAKSILVKWSNGTSFLEVVMKDDTKGSMSINNIKTIE